MGLVSTSLWSVSHSSNSEVLALSLGVLGATSARNEAKSNRNGVWKGSE